MMERQFTPPAITTKDYVGAIPLDYAFQLTARFDPRQIEQTASGGRIYRAIVGGEVRGPRLNANVYADSGGDYGVVRAVDGVEDIHSRFMVRDANGEWLYFEHVGYLRPDGYHRIQAFFDADMTGPYAWLNDAVMLGLGKESEDGREVVFTYYQAL